VQGAVAGAHHGGHGDWDPNVKKHAGHGGHGDKDRATLLPIQVLTGV
jgi:hypothetical protein